MFIENDTGINNVNICKNLSYDLEVEDMEDITNFVKNTKERLDLKNDYVFKRI